jgi:hypothetical protein
VNQWGYISGEEPTPPRTSLPIGTTADPTDIWSQGSPIVVHGLLSTEPATAGQPRKLWKLLLGQAPQAIWTGPRFPNASTATQTPAEQVFADCGMKTGCLYELLSDPSEHRDVAAQFPETVASLRAALERSNKTVWSPSRPTSSRACDVALAQRKDPHYDFGWWGPFADV